MKIAHIITRLILGGAQENTVLSCEGLDDLGHEVLLISGPTTGPEGSLLERVQRGNYTFVETPALVRAVHPMRDYRAIGALATVLRDWQPDVVHTHSSKAGILGRMAARRARVPHIVHTIHGMSFNRTQSAWQQKLYALLERRCARYTDALVCVADAMRKQSSAAGIGKPEQFVTVRSGMETAAFDPSRYDRATVRQGWGFHDEQVVVATVARLFRNKGYEQLIPIMQRAVKAAPQLRFVWIGDGADRLAYERQLKTYGLFEHVHFTGLVAPTEIPKLLAGADLLAHASQWEGLPRAVVQALLMQRAVVSFDIDGAPEVVLPGATGELAPLNDLDAFAAALVKLANDTALRERYGTTGRARYLLEFDHAVMAQRLAQVYDAVANRRPVAKLDFSAPR